MASNDNAKPEDDRPEAEPEESEASEAAAEAEALEEEATETDTEEPEPALQKVVAELEAERAQLKEQLLRTLAEMENVRRRAQRDREDSARFAAAPLAKDLLSVRDNLTRAIASVPEEALAEDGQLKAFFEGIVLTERSLMDAFARHHIEAIDPLGEKMDPHQHEAMFEVPDSDQPTGTVAQVIEVGYRLHERLLRPARVGVAKGGSAAKPAPKAEAEDQTAEAAKDAAAPQSDKGPDRGSDKGPDGGSEGESDGEGKPGQRVDTAV